MKLSNTQIKVLNKIIEEINTAKSFMVYEEYNRYIRCKDGREDEESYNYHLNLWYDGNPKNDEWVYEDWILGNVNMVKVMANTKTLERLEKEGYIKIIRRHNDVETVLWTGKTYEG